MKLGAKPLIHGWAGAGMGDLLATAAGVPSSRNYILGMELAKGRRTDEIIKELGVTVEGVPTTEGPFVNFRKDLDWSCQSLNK